MQKKNQLGFFILINVIVSAVTMSLVLLIWTLISNRNPAPNDPTLAFPTQAETRTSTSGTAESPGTGSEVTQQDWNGELEIMSISGVGDLETERLRIQYTGEGEVLLLGWTLRDENNHSYYFPALSLHNGAEVTLYTKQGNDTVFDLFWGSDEAIWQAGEAAKLIDPQGEQHAQYLIP